MKKLIVGITAPTSVILIEGQLRYFTENGYKTYLLAPDDERTRNYCEQEGCELLPVSIKREISIFSDIISLIKIIFIIRKIKPEIINVGTPKMGLLGMIAAWLLGVKKRIYTCRGFRFEHETGIKHKVLVLMEKLTSKISHKVICISNSVREEGFKFNIFSESKSVVINKGSSNGIPLTRFKPENIERELKLNLKKQLELDDCFIFGYIGRLVDRKGINELYAAFTDLYSQNNKLRMLFVGSPEFGQIHDKNLIDNMRKHPGIILAGFQKDVPLYLSIMDVFVLPAWWEGFGNVLVQAAAMGLPVISTTGTGTRDAVSKDYNGLLISPKSISELFEAMRLLLHDKELRKKLGANGIEWAKNFDSQIIWNGMEELYKN